MVWYELGGVSGREFASALVRCLCKDFRISELSELWVACAQ